MKIPTFYLFLDAVGMILLVLGVLGVTGVDIGLPVLARIGIFLIVIGLALAITSPSPARKSDSR